MNEIRKILKSFIYAFHGMKVLLRERNFRVHLFFMLLALLFSFILKLSGLEFAVIILTICSVLAAESFNTSIEKLSDILRDELKLNYSATKIPRDIGAFAVLILSIGSVIVAACIFIPKLILLLSY